MSPIRAEDTGSWNPFCNSCCIFALICCAILQFWLFLEKPHAFPGLKMLCYAPTRTSAALVGFLILLLLLFLSFFSL